MRRADTEPPRRVRPRADADRSARRPARPGSGGRLATPRRGRHRLPALVLPLLLLAAGLLATSAPADAQVDARLLRQPDVSETHITFVYGGDVWLVPKEGGTAHRLSSPPGEESFPRFSPDGSEIAFTGNYDGNEDVYRMPVRGGRVERVTHHPQGDRTLGWFPDGEGILYASSMESGRQRYSQFWRAPREGGLPAKLPVPYGEFGTLSPDGEWIAYTPRSRAFRTWKRYRGGWAPDIHLFNLETLESRRVTDDPANDDQPMWHESTLYFLSDRGPEKRYNIWAYDLESRELRQVTRFADFDVHFPALGPSEIVFEAGGEIHLLDLASEEARPVEVAVYTDRSTVRPRTESVEERIEAGGISPTGQRAVFGARGEVFTVPAEHGPVLNLTHSSDAAERTPAWSPDGEWIAYWTDAPGEYQLAVRPAEGGEERILTDFDEGFRYRPFWSPDSRRIAFVDQAMRIRVFDTRSESVTTLDEGLWMTHGSLASFRASWSPDSRWLAWSRGLENRNDALFLWDADSGDTHRVTSGFYSDHDPAFGPDGDYLFFLTNRSFDPAYSDLDGTWIYPGTEKLAALPLRADVPSPLAPRVDREPAEDEEEDEEEENGEDEEDEEEDDDGREEPEPVEIDLEGIERRIVELPPEAGSYAEIAAADGKVIYRRLPPAGATDGESPLLFFDLEEREEKTILPNIDGWELSADGEKLLVALNDTFAIVGAREDREIETPLRTAEMSTVVDPPAEWRQMFADTWRFTRDYFYDPNMHGVDWRATRARYEPLLEDAVTRWDVNFIIGEMIAELNASHTYRGGGDAPEAPERGVGLLGVEWELADGAYRIAEIIRPAPWISEVRSPLDAPGVEVDEGDWVLAVNGAPLDTDEDPWAAFQGMAGETVVLTVNDRPTTEGARTVTVETLDDETRLRHLAWIQDNRERVAEATDGRVGYIYVPDTGIEGQNELVRQFRAQFHRDGLIIDERFNSGGQIPDRFVELLARPELSYWAVRDGRDWQWPPVAHFGPQVMLINGWSGSGGDAFPYYFRAVERGPLIGTRTWGGLIGISGVPSLVDGGGVTVPTFRMYGPEGEWFAEGHGVEPDIQVEDDPTALARGTDPQLERAIEEVMRALEANPPTPPERPDYEDRGRPEGETGDAEGGGR